jgi:hypothetical protein
MNTSDLGGYTSNASELDTPWISFHWVFPIARACSPQSPEAGVPNVTACAVPYISPASAPYRHRRSSFCWPISVCRTLKRRGWIAPERVTHAPADVMIDTSPFPHHKSGVILAESASRWPGAYGRRHGSGLEPG